MSGAAERAAWAFARAAPMARTLLYEGYVLFPYRGDSLKNARAMTFGELVRGASLAGECPVRAGTGARLDGRLSFLQPIRRTLLDTDHRPVCRIDAGDRRFVAFTEAREHSLSFDLALSEVPMELAYVAEPVESEERIEHAGAALGTVLRQAERLACTLRVEARPAARTGDFIVSFRATHVDGEAPVHGELAALHSPHLLVHVDGGAFESVIDPSPEMRDDVDRCESEGWWPVLAGPEGDRSVVLLSPIIVYDHPRIAPESPSDLYDATENDELLTLAILSLTDDERKSMRATDPRAAELLARIDELGAGLGSLHGAIRSRRARAAGDPRSFARGDRVVLRPSGRDAFDGALAGRCARVVDVQCEVDGREHLVVVIDDDPGRDLGLSELGVGHRFFVSRDEVEPLAMEPP